MTRGEFCDTAKKTICNDRQDQYGSPENNFETIAIFWHDYIYHKYHIDTPISPTDVGIMMTLFKVGRICSGVYKNDNFIDAIGYMACAGELAGEEDRCQKHQ